MIKPSFVQECSAVYLKKGRWYVIVKMEKLPACDDDLIWFLESLLHEHTKLFYPHRFYEKIIFDDFPEKIYKLMISVGLTMEIFMRISRRKWKLTTVKRPWSKNGGNIIRARVVIGRHRNNYFKRVAKIHCSIFLSEYTELS